MTRRLLCLVGTLALAGAACGTGDARDLVSPQARRPTTTSTTTSAPAPTTTTAPAASTTGAPAPPPAAPADGVLAFGDSVMLDVASQLQAHGIAVDASVGRQFINAARDLTIIALAHRLPPTVVVGLGTNGPFDSSQFDAVMQALGPARKVAFVNVCEPRWWQDQVNTALAEGVERWKHKAVLVDWHAASCGHPEWFATDGIHVNGSAAGVYADLVLRAIA